MMNTTSIPEEGSELLKSVTNNSICEMDNVNTINSPSKSLSFTYSSLMKPSSLDIEDPYSTSVTSSSSTEIWTQSNMIMIPTSKTCKVCSVSSSTCCCCRCSTSPSVSTSNFLNTTKLSSDIPMNSCYKLSQNDSVHPSYSPLLPLPPPSHHHHQRQQQHSQLIPSTFNSRYNVNSRHGLDPIQCDQCDTTGAQYSTNPYKRIWRQSNELPIHNNDYLNSLDSMNKLQAWLKSPLEECDLRWNGQFLGDTMKSSRGIFSTNSESIPTTTSTTGTNNLLATSLQSPCSLSTSLMSPNITDYMNMKSFNTSIKQFNAYDIRQYDDQQNFNYLPYKFTKSSLDYLNTKSSKQNIESNSYKQSIKYHGHIKKPLNAFMLFMKEMRSQVIAECTLKESAAINQILGRKWHALSSEAQAKYYKLAKQEKELHQQLYPGWSARDNYATQVKRRNRTTKVNRNTTLMTTTTTTTMTTTTTSTTTTTTTTTSLTSSSSCYPDTEFWYSSNYRNNSFNTYNNNNTSNSTSSSGSSSSSNSISNGSSFRQQFTDSLNTSFPHTHTISTELCNSSLSLNNIDTTDITKSVSTTTVITCDYNRLNSLNQFTTLPYAHFNDYVSYRNLLTPNTGNSSTEINIIPPNNENQYCQLQSMHKSMKTSDYAVHSLMDLNYESVIQSDDNSSEQNVTLKCLNKYDSRIPCTLINSSIDQNYIRSNLSYPIDRQNYTKDSNNSLFHLWHDNESIHQVTSQSPYYSTSYLDFYSSTNDYVTTKFTDTLQSFNRRCNRLDYNTSTDLQQNSYFTDISYLHDYHHHHQHSHENNEVMKYFNRNCYIIPNDNTHEELNTISNQLNDDTFITLNNSMPIINIEQGNSKPIEQKYIEQYFNDQLTQKQFTSTSSNHHSLLF
ncbi:hypothetical protein MN116_000621 [Schistosoma mekongi]|uniref:HMG box domain-containing protein n=1 Tax=Schistosoma mekongi TaxID=38744 RepID=A0AAE2D9P1_SCHME|nr:hypothetical protein MN116_000621 [Schistosoma mekongi]